MEVLYVNMDYQNLNVIKEIVMELVLDVNMVEEQMYVMKVIVMEVKFVNMDD